MWYFTRKAVGAGRAEDVYWKDDFDYKPQQVDRKIHKLTESYQEEPIN